MAVTLSDLERRCLDAGVKMTAQRRTILQVLEAADDHPSVDEVYRRAKDIDSSISIATVYRTLSLFDEMNIVQRHDFNETFARFEVNIAHHHHLIDVATGEVIEFQNEPLELLKAKIAEELGYDLVDHRLELYGRKKKS
ncbi:MAG: Fur family transcriptional regulator [Alphaproteobacteria bacterium]